MNISLQHLALLVVWVPLLVAGCGGNLAVKGKVTYSDGTPVTVGLVNFVSDTVQARGTISSDGSYVMGSLKEADGLPPGSYKVYLTATEVADTGAAPEKPAIDSMGNPVMTMGKVKQLVDRKFMTAASTPLSCQVPIAGNRFDIQVEKPAHIK